MQWYRADLHLHTPASHDYIDADARYIDILRKAEQQGIDLLAFTDHNTVGGYAALLRELEMLRYLKELGRAQIDELHLLAEYERLLDKILVLPGFEFTATFGFHVLGIFSPETTLREMEHLLLTLNVPVSVLENGNADVGATADVLTAYRVIDEAGGICIAAHVNAAHGVAMKGVDFGGQTRIAYTQDAHLHALEATDLGRRGRNTQRFFDGTKPEYPRKMRVIQNSDAHSLTTMRDERGRMTRWGVGERVTEYLLPELTFDALREMFLSNDFSRSRPYTPNHKPEDYVQSAREEGPSVVQAFHESMDRKGGRLYNIISDVCAFANTNGGTVYVGISPNPKKAPVGIDDVQGSINDLQSEINSLITPTLKCEVDTQDTQGKTVIRIQVPYGEDRPYAVENSKIYVRDESDTSQAIRDEVVNLVRQGMTFKRQAAVTPEATQVTPVTPVAPVETPAKSPVPEVTAPEAESAAEGGPPRAGVEIVGAEQRNNRTYYIMRDLRNGNVVKNVTRSSARRLWHYAIKQRESNPVNPAQVQWQGDFGLWRRYSKGGNTRYDLVQRDNGNLRVYYGVTENGMHGEWQHFIVEEDDNS